MKNFKSNLKGFTLVELIVVMAIIGVLAAVLVPGLLGYMKDSRISQANQNAHTVLTAVSAWQTKEVAANNNSAIFAPSGTGATATASSITANGAPITITVGTLTSTNLRPKLGESFKGNFFVKFSNDGGGVSYALWSGAAITTTSQLTASDQDTNSGEIVGCAPLA